MCLCSAAKDTEAKEGALQTELHDLCAGSETEGLDGFLYWYNRWAAHSGVHKPFSDMQSIHFLNTIEKLTMDQFNNILLYLLN